MTLLKELLTESNDWMKQVDHDSLEVANSKLISGKFKRSGEWLNDEQLTQYAKVKSNIIDELDADRQSTAEERKSDDKRNKAQAARAELRNMP